VTKEWIRLHNEELRDFYSSPSIIRIIKSRKTRRAGQGRACNTNEREEDCL
jgi:hypothetical protein